MGLDWVSGKAHKLNAMQVKKAYSPGHYAQGEAFPGQSPGRQNNCWILPYDTSDRTIRVISSRCSSLP